MLKGDHPKPAAKSTKRWLWVPGILAFLLASLLALALTLPFLINLDWVKEQIVAQLSREAGGRVNFQKADLFFFPRPYVVIHHGTLTVPGKISATLPSLTVYPEIQSVLRGEVRVARVATKNASLRVDLPEKSGARRNPISFKDLKEAVGSVLAIAAERAPGLAIEVEKGELVLAEESRSFLKVQDISGRVLLPPADLRVDLTCRSDLWERCSLRASFNPKDEKGEGRMLVNQLRLHTLVDRISYPLTPRLVDSNMRLEVRFEVDRGGTFKGQFQGSVPHLTFRQAQETFALKGKDLKGRFSTDEKKTSVVLESLDLDHPRVTLSGEFEMDRATPLIRLALEGRGIDVPSTRAATLFLAGSVPAVQIIFDFVRAGRVPQVRVVTEGKSWNDVGGTNSFSVKGKLFDGSVVVPKAIAFFLPGDLNLTGVRGDVVVSKGILEAKNLEARWKNEHLQDVRLRAGLEGRDAPLHLEGSSEIDLSQLPTLLKHLFRSEPVLTTLAKIRDLEGRARGRFVLGESMESIELRVDVQEMNLSARYESVPYRLEIERGKVFYDEDTLRVEEVTGRVGRSSFSQLTGSLALKGVPLLEVGHGTLSIALDEIYPWMSSSPSLSSVRESLSALSGTLVLSIQDLRGPLLEPKAWRFNATGEARGIVASVAQIPKPIGISSAKLQADPKRILFDGAQASLLGASFTGSGRLEGYLEGPFRLDLTARVDLAEVPPILQHFVKVEGIQREVGLVDQRKGHATARLILEGPAEAMRPRIEFWDLSLSGSYRRIPYPIELTGGRVSYEPDRVTVRDMAGRIGGSSFSEVTAQLDFQNQPRLDLQSGNLSVLLDEIFRWLTPLEGFRETLKDAGSLKGIFTLSRTRVKGPLLHPLEWEFEVEGEMRNLRAESPLLPGPVSVPSGRLTANQENLQVMEVQVKLLESSFTTSGTVEGYLKGPKKVDLDLKGAMSLKGIQWLSRSLKVKEGSYVKSPLLVKGARLSWQKGDRTRFQGDLEGTDGPRVSLDVSHLPGHLAIHRLAFRDETSDANLSFDQRGQKLDLIFSGTLSEQTLDKIFSGYESQRGRAQGDFRLKVAMDQPERATAEGHLEIDDLSFPWQLEKPLDLERVSLEARGRWVKVSSTKLRWGDKRLGLSGEVRFSNDQMRLDLDVSTEGLSLDEIKEMLASRDGKPGRKGFDLPIRGEVRVKADSFQAGRFTWRPVRANILLLPERVLVEVSEASVCGISTTGSLRIAAPDLSFESRGVSKNQDLDAALHCLFETSLQMNGTLDVTADLQGKGEVEGLVRSLEGSAGLEARNGRIYRFNLLSKVFSLLNMAELFVGKFPDLARQGLPFDSIKMKGKMEKGKFVFSEAVLDGPTVELAGQGEIDFVEGKLDITVLVAPLRTIDRIVKIIPLVGRILGGRLVFTPVRVSGNLEDPTVTPLSPSAIGRSLFDIVKRTVNLPFDIISPFFPRNREKEKEKD